MAMSPTSRARGLRRCWVLMTVLGIAATGFAESVAAQDLQLETKEVEYFEGQISRIEEKTVRLIDGSIWLLALKPLLPVLPLTDVVVVIERRGGDAFGMMYIEDDLYVAALLEGRVVPRRGVLTWVTRRIGGRGRTANGRWPVLERIQLRTSTTLDFAYRPIG